MFSRLFGGAAARGFTDLSPTELHGQQANLRIVDVREPSEFRDDLGHLHGAVSVPLATVDAACASWQRDEPIVLICRSGRRSVAAAQLLAGRGFTRLYNLDGGMLGWARAGLPVER